MVGVWRMVSNLWCMRIVVFGMNEFVNIGFGFLLVNFVDIVW